jgi:hypothetical protein
MHISNIIGLAANLLSGVSAAACSSPMTIDNFSKWSTNTNSLGEYTSGKDIEISLPCNMLIYGRRWFYELDLGQWWNSII